MEENKKRGGEKNYLKNKSQEFFRGMTCKCSPLSTHMANGHNCKFGLYVHTLNDFSSTVFKMKLHWKTTVDDEYHVY